MAATQEVTAHEATAQDLATSVEMPDICQDPEILFPGLVSPPDPAHSGSLKNLRKRRFMVGKAWTLAYPFHCMKGTLEFKSKCALEFSRRIKRESPKAKDEKLHKIVDLLHLQGNPLEGWKAVGVQMIAHTLKSRSRYAASRLGIANASRQAQYGRLKDKTDQQAIDLEWRTRWQALAEQAEKKFPAQEDAADQEVAQQEADSDIPEDPGIWDLIDFGSDSGDKDSEPSDSNQPPPEADDDEFFSVPSPPKDD